LVGPVQAAVCVDKLLRGAKPGDLPVEQPTTFELLINMKTAKPLGLTIFPSILLRPPAGAGADAGDRRGARQAEMILRAWTARRVVN
jgi:hypothetical protein